MAKSGNFYYEQGIRPQLAAHGRRKAQNIQVKRNRNARVRSASVGNEMDQTELNSRAAFAIRDLFPKIPDADIHQIVDQAFQKVLYLLWRRELS